MTKQALRRAVVFGVGFITIIHILAFISRTIAPTSTDDFLQRDRRNMAHLQQVRNDVDVFVVGNSHAASANFDSFDNYTGVRFARASADIFEINYTIRSLIDQMPELDTVFINVSYFAFFRDNTHVDLTYFQTRRTHLYMVAPPSTPIDGDTGRFLLAKTQPIAPIMAVLREDNWYGVFTNLVNGSVVEASQSPEAATDDAAPVCEHQPPQQLEEHGYATAIRHLDVTDRVLQQNADVALKAYATWSETISQLQANNIEVVLYTPPYFASYSYFFETEGGAQQLDTTQQLTAQLADKFEIDYYDFSAEPTIINDHTLFADSDHLNECGSEAFTELIAAAWQANR